MNVKERATCQHRQLLEIECVYVHVRACVCVLAMMLTLVSRGSPEMWYWVFLWGLFSSLLVHGGAGLLMLVTLQRHRRGRLITVVMVSAGFLASLSGTVVTSKWTFYSFYDRQEVRARREGACPVEGACH